MPNIWNNLYEIWGQEYTHNRLLIPQEWRYFTTANWIDIDWKSHQEKLEFDISFKNFKK